MRKIRRWLLGQWEDLRGHIKFWAITAIISAASGGTVTAWLARWVQIARGAPKQDSLGYIILAVMVFCALMLMFGLIVLLKRLPQGSTTGGPQLVLSLGNVIWQYRREDNLTVFFISASVLNKGEPSVTLSWKATYKIGTISENMDIYHIMGNYSINVDKERLTFTNGDLVNLKTLETPIQKGQFIAGRLLLAVSGDRTSQVESIQHSIEIECEDYAGNKSTAKYKPDSKPPKTLLTHYKEKRELIIEQPSLTAPQPEAATRTPDPPLLNEGK
jgi:hypothetical protein